MDNSWSNPGSILGIKAMLVHNQKVKTISIKIRIWKNIIILVITFDQMLCKHPFSLSFNADTCVFNLKQKSKSNRLACEKKN